MMTKLSFEKWMLESGYHVKQFRGQRIFRPLDPDWDSNLKYDRVKDLEVFIKNLPEDLMEEELIPFLNRIGPVYQTRILVNFSHLTKGIAYVTFAEEDDAFRAVLELNGECIREGYPPVRVDFSVNNRRLAIRGFDPALTESKLHTELEVHFPGEIKKVVYKYLDADRKLIDVAPNPIAIVTFVSHQAASTARRAFLPGLIAIGGLTLEADWHKPQDTQSLFVSLSTTDHISPEDLVSYFATPTTEVIRIAVKHRCAFIKYKTMEQAYQVMTVFRKLPLPLDIGNGVLIRKVSWPERN